MHAAEVHKLQSVISENSTTISSLKSQLSQLQSQVDDQREALDAAQRLSEQLERKEEAMNALRDEGMFGRIRGDGLSLTTCTAFTKY